MMADAIIRLFGKDKMRRLPVYLLIDTSGSMKGAPIEAVNKGLIVLVKALQDNPDMVEKAYLSIFSFDRDVKEVLPLTEVDGLDEIPALVTPEFSPTHMGRALEALIEKVNNGGVIRNTKDVAGDYKPLLFVITDGKPSDLEQYKKMTQKIKECKFAIIVACAAGPKAKTEPLKLLTENVCVLANMDEKSFADFFICVSQSIPTNEWDFDPDTELPPDVSTLKPDPAPGPTPTFDEDEGE